MVISIVLLLPLGAYAGGGGGEVGFAPNPNPTRRPSPTRYITKTPYIPTPVNTLTWGQSDCWRKHCGTAIAEARRIYGYNADILSWVASCASVHLTPTPSGIVPRCPETFPTDTPVYRR